MKINDTVFFLHDGFYAFVNGKSFGPWACVEYARAGMQVERRRANKKTEEERLCTCGHGIYWHDDYEFNTHECNFSGCQCEQFKDRAKDETEKASGA